MGEPHEQRITVERDGPYHVQGAVPLRRIRPILSEHGEPLTWRTAKRWSAAPDEAWLCRCGRSSDKPFCDGSHADVQPPFDGTEAAPATRFAERARRFEGSGVVVHDDRVICEHAGFCATRSTSIWKLLEEGATADSTVRAQVMTMVERCPSGALTFRLPGEDEDVEPDLPVAIGIVDDGPLFVSGGVVVERSDGTPLETRNRVTLCRCGQSAIKPLCDGSHERAGFRDPSPPADA